MSGKGKKKDAASVQIYSRVRKLMPWEPKKISVEILSSTNIVNHTDKGAHEYSFNEVFGMARNNEQVYKSMCKPLVKKVLEGYNAVLIAYGQTGSGKTHTLVGKPEQNVKGVLTMSLEALINEKSVKSVFLSGVEAYGTHVSRIELFDLFAEQNSGTDWTTKQGKASFDPLKGTTREIKNLQDCFDKINQAHDASHFAPTGKNPESSRGHVAFVAQVNQEIDGSLLTSYFVCVDLAGSEGESAFTKEFVRKVDQATLMARRLEAGVINTGLSQLQVVFNELKVKGKLSKVQGNGLRRILHAYINAKCMISVCFTISPAKNNSMTTASTLKFAVQAGMVKVKPIKAEKQVNYKQLVDELQAHIEDQDKIIAELNDSIQEFEEQLNTLEDDLEDAKKEISNLMLEAAKGGKKDAEAQKVHDKAQASVHKLAPSIAGIANLKGFLTRKESSMSINLRSHLQRYNTSGRATLGVEVDDSMVATNISEARVDAQITRKINERAQSMMDMSMVNKNVPSAKVTVKMSQSRNKSVDADAAGMTVNPDKYGLVGGDDDDDDQPNFTYGGGTSNVSAASGNEVNLSHEKQESIVVKSTTVREIDVDVDESGIDIDQLAMDATMRYGGDAKENADDLEGDAPLDIDFEPKDTAAMSREEVNDYCDELETRLVEEKTLRAALQQSQSVIIDHLMETNEALLRWFQLKKIL